MVRREQVGTLHTVVADSLTEFAQYPAPSAANRSHGAVRISDPIWTGAQTDAEVADVMAHGWTAGAKRIREAFGALSIPQAKSIRRRQAWGDDGEEVNIDRLRSGQLETMWRRTERPMVDGSPVIRIWVPLNASAFCSADSIFWRGAAAAVVADALEEAGYRCEITAYVACSHVWKSGDDSFMAVTLKAAGDPISLASMALVAYAPTLRRVVFRQWLADAHVATSGLGHVKHGRPAQAEEDDLCIPSEMLSEQAARAWVAAQVQKFNGSEEDGE